MKGNIYNAEHDEKYNTSYLGNIAGLRKRGLEREVGMGVTVGEGKETKNKGKGRNKYVGCREARD